jgi:hypothetical protein
MRWGLVQAHLLHEEAAELGLDLAGRRPQRLAHHLQVLRYKSL